MTHVRITTFELVGDFTADENLIERVREAVRAVANSSPAFLSYESGYDEEGNIVSVSRWESEEQAAGPMGQMRAWLAENIGEGMRVIRTSAFDSVVSIVA